ncbi:MAG: hypothetical protein AB7K24_04320 [Gemmataceae bacterium]
MRELFKTLQERRRPEDVAEMIRAELPDIFTKSELTTLGAAARHSWKNSFGLATSMLEKFKQPVPPRRQVRKARELFERTRKWTTAQCADPQRIEGLLHELSPLIAKNVGASDFKADRLNRAQRVEAGLDLSRRRYNKLFRMLARLEHKLRKYLRELRKYDYLRIGKSRLATQLTWEDFARDPATAAFIAYFTARCNLRSEFTNTAQQRPYDEVAHTLFQKLEGQPEQTNWWAVAHVFPDRIALDHLGDRQRGTLLGRWLQIMHGIAQLLREVWQSSDFNRATMIVRRGNDSSTWNNTASAWNRAREAWIGLLHSMGMEEELDALCFGKVLRLMAADVASWHRASGGGLEPDTLVWNELPLPWEVLSGEVSCTRALVENVCRRHKVDPIKKGWMAPPPERKVEQFRPTPELVHGVTVASPELAAVLRKAGWFSGKVAWTLPDTVGPVEVRRDEHGFALGAGPVDGEDKS